MLTGHFVVEKLNTMKANPNHDSVSGRFTYGAGSRTRDREDAREQSERQEARAVRAGMRQPNSGQLILPEHVARQRGESVNDLFDVREANDLEMASKETGGSRVFNFSNGEGSELDKNVRFVTNTDSNGNFARGVLRVEIVDPDKRGRNVYERKMSELPTLVKKVFEKKYAPISQHRRNTAHRMKFNEHHDAQGRFATSDAPAQDKSKSKALMKAEMSQWGLTDSQANERGTLRTLLVAKVHHAYTTACDQLSMRGYLTQEQRMKVTNAFGAALKFLNENIDPDIAALPIGNNDLSDIANTMKADGHWVTLPNGARIQIRGAQGGAKETSPAPQQQTERREQTETSARDDSANELTHEQRTTIVKKLAAKMGFDADMVEMKEKDEPDENGAPMAEYDPESGKINVFPEGFAHGKMELIGTLAHEFMHAKFHRVIDQLNAERKEFLAGKDRRELKVYNNISPVFSTERASYKQADGQTKYSTMFWQRYEQNPNAQTYMNAVNETLAEVDFLKATGREGDIHPLWKSLQNRVNGFAGANQ